MNNNSPLIRMVGISKVYQTGELLTPVLNGIDLEVERGEFAALMGPSGSGKSTLLHILGLLDRPTSGSYYLNDRDVAGLDDDEASTTRNRLLGFVFQSFYLIAYATAMENVLLPGLYSDTPQKELRRRAEELLVRVGLGDRMHHRPSQLSGGQQQRVALARAMLNNPELILADEPTGQLDSNTSEEIMELLTAVNKQGKTIIVVTHDPQTAAYARRKIQIQDGFIVT